jgi:RNA polymerase sigma-70 factor (ECF subfamily)
VLVLREYEGLSYQEIAYTLDIPIGTVMSRLNYARSRIRESLAAYLRCNERARQRGWKPIMTAN